MKYTGFTRLNIELFYTRSEVAKFCYDKFKEVLGNNLKFDTDLVIEPSAGTGEFADLIMNDFDNVNCYDIHPKRDYIVKQDFTLLDFSSINEKLENNEITNIHYIGNPPFGRQSSLLKIFIKLCCSNAKTISFILPKSFKKYSMYKAFQENYHCIYSYDLDENSFYLPNGSAHNVPTIFQIWEHKPIARTKPVLMNPCGFKFVGLECNPDFSFRRVGIYAGTLDTDVIKSIQSHYFIKLDDNMKNKKNILFQQLKNITFDTNNTVGPKSISKPEVIEKYNNIFNLYKN